MPKNAHDLTGLCVLLVEDTPLVAEVIAEYLIGCGCTVIGPVGSLDLALPLAREARLDGALLDIDLAGEYSYPAAELLDERQVPFIFLSGYDDAAMLPEAWRERPRLAKPFRPEVLLDLVRAHFPRQMGA